MVGACVDNPRQRTDVGREVFSEAVYPISPDPLSSYTRVSYVRDTWGHVKNLRVSTFL